MSKTIKLNYKMCGKRRGENDIDEYYIQDDATDKTVAIVYGHGSIGNETHAKELVRRWNAFEDGGIVEELRTACKAALEAATVKLDTYAASEKKQTEVILKLEAALAKS